MNAATVLPSGANRVQANLKTVALPSLSGEPRKFSRSDLESPVTREFCGECGTHLATRRPGLPLIILKVGTLDDPSLFGAPQMAIYTIDKQPFHIVPEGLQTFERLPPR